VECHAVAVVKFGFLQVPSEVNLASELDDSYCRHSPEGPAMDRPYTTREKARITAGAIASLVIVGWLVVLAIVFLSVR
jgi:hypothetical protein